jgi:hypothetical protein
MESRTELIDLSSVNDMLVDFAEVDEFDDSVNFEELEEELEQELQLQLEDLAFLKEERAKIGSPDNLCETIKGVVWEQFINQIAVTAGTDFIKENHGLTLDLSNAAHIQTAEDFAQGKIATHNHISREQLEQNYERYKNTSHKEFREKYVNPGMDATLPRAGKLKEQGVDTVKDIYTGRQISTETKLPNGKNNPNAAEREHVKSSAELYKDPSLQMANNNEELAAVINNPENLQGYTTKKRNNRKSDNSADEMSNQDKNEHWKKADKRAEEYIEQEKKRGEERLKKEGRKTQREEAFRIGGKALRAVVMQLLADLVKEIISKLILWFKAAKRTLSMLIESLKAAILSFVSKLKEHMVNAGNTVITTIATAIMGPIVSLIKKVWAMLKQGWKSLKEAINYIRDPENKGKPIDILILEVGKIVIAGLTGIGAMVLGELIEKALCAIPGAGVVFATEIPLLGSLANILGIFLGAVVSGIIGAIAINLIQKKIESKQKIENNRAQTDVGNRILKNQAKLQAVLIEDVSYTETKVENNIEQRHKMAGNIIVEAVENIKNNINIDTTVDDKLSSVSGGLDDLLCEEGI